MEFHGKAQFVLVQVNAEQKMKKKTGIKTVVE